MNNLTKLLNEAMSLHRDGKLCGTDDLYKSLVGSIGESQIVSLTEGESVNGKFDVLGKTRYPGRIEVKTANKPTEGKLGAWSLMCKRSGCDWFALVDASSLEENKYRISMIPHDDMFAFLDTPNSKGNCPDNIRWSASYNSTDSKCVEATELFLKYEIDY